MISQSLFKTLSTPGQSLGSEGFGMVGMILLIILLTTGSILVVVTVAPTLSNRQAKETATKGNILRAAITVYKAGHSLTTYPATLGALVTNDNTPATCTLDNTPASATYLTLQGWCGPYVDQVFVEAPNDYKTDGWGTTFTYNSGTGALSSCGPNRTCGDGDDISF